MIKMPYTYLVYSIIAFVLFAMGCWGFLTHRVEEWYPLLFPLAFGIAFFVLFFLKKEKPNAEQ